MKNLLNITKIAAAVLALALYAASCSEEKDNYDGTVTIPEQYLTDGLTFSGTGGAIKVSILGRVSSIGLTCDSDWASVEMTNHTSYGTAVFMVTVGQNPGYDDRTATLSVTDGSKVYGTIPVTQLNADGLIFDQTTYNVTAEAQTIEVSAQITDEPEIICNDSWISLAALTKALSSGSYTFDISINHLAERTGTVTFTVGTVSENLTVIQAESETNSTMPSDAKTLVSQIYVGVNIGNTLESTGGETAWGNPQVTKTYIDGLKFLGFNAVRIPCSWDQYIIEGDEDYTVDPDWMARVTEVVDYCLDDDLYVVLNIHNDGGWLETNISKGYDADIDAEQKSLWTQIATNFKDYDEHLLFAGCNEPNASTADAVTTLLTYEQTFVDAVRATGGNNAVRCLVIQGPDTDITETVNSDLGFAMPGDDVSDRMILEVHYYEPYQFCLMEEDADWGKMFYYWGSQNYLTGSDHNATWGEEDWVDQQFGYIKTNFVDSGIPAIVGEFCALKRTMGDGEDQDLHNASRQYFNEYVVKTAKNDGLAPFYWETGTDIYRTTGLAKEDYAIEGLMTGAASGTYPF